MYIRWFIFSCDFVSLHPAVDFLRMWFSSIFTVIKNNGGNASPWNLPLWIFASSKLFPPAVNSTIQIFMVFSVKCIIIIITMRVFHISVSWSSLAGVWVTACHLKSILTVFNNVRGLLNKFPDFFRMGTSPLPSLSPPAVTPLFYRFNNFWKAPWKSSCVSVSMTFITAFFISSMSRLFIITACLKVTNYFSFFANSLMSSSYIRWLIVYCDLFWVRCKVASSV